jgi:SAM-dependent methyltransferase
MIAKPGRGAPKRDWAALGLAAARRGDLPGARVALQEATKADRRNASLRYNLALVLDQLGEIDESAGALTEALRLKPDMVEAARRLSRMCARYRFSNPAGLDPFGLKAALAFDTASRQPLVEVALAHVFATEPPLIEALAATRPGADATAAARTLLRRRKSDGIGNALLTSALECGVVTDPRIERLLTAARRVLLLDPSEDDVRDRAVSTFALALLAQCWNTDQAWAETPEETAAVAALSIDHRVLLEGDVGASFRLLLAALYRPLNVILGSQPSSDAYQGIRPKPLRDCIVGRLARLAEEREIARALPRLSGTSDATSRRVAHQYETSPYPRWQDLHVSEAGALRRTLERFFPPPRLAFMDQPFDVLIAGAGTGLHAVQTALAYGPKARVLAIDLSAPSLAYAKRMARHFGAETVEFLAADIRDLDGLQREFDIVECVGVLHHMADPWAGWRSLLSRLRPDGLMYIGLYSAVSRRNLAALRSDPHHPGPGCDDPAARAYRARLLDLADGEAGAELQQSPDFYNLNEFRDLVLHESEQHVMIAEIEDFLAKHNLTFRGFTLQSEVVEDALPRMGATWPGPLTDWARHEADYPRTFDGMYKFWCERAR